jgi:hypothetical protein
MTIRGHHGLLLGAGGGPPAGLLDAWLTNLIVACDLRLLVGAYSGSPLIRVRRSGDSAESDFTNTGAAVDLSAVAAWVVAGGGTQHGYIVTVYDQTGGGAHATNATTSQQPQIVVSGTANTEIHWDGVSGSAFGSHRLECSPTFSSSSSFTYFLRAWSDNTELFGGDRALDTSDVSAARPAAFWDAGAGGMSCRYGGFFQPRAIGFVNTSICYAFRWDGAAGNGADGNRAWAGASEASATGGTSGAWSAPSAVTSEVIQIGNRADAARGAMLRFKGMAVYRIAHADADIVTINGLLA